MTVPVPEWLLRAAETAKGPLPEWFAQFASPEEPPRRAAVLILFGSASPLEGEDVVLTERSRDLRSHAGQISFPGGAVDEGDSGTVEAALREAEEEVGVDPASVEIVSELPAVFMTPTKQAITPVLAWWPEPHPIGVVDEREVARVVRAPLSELLDPASRFTVVHPSGYQGPGFEYDGMFIWGFTATLLSTVFDIAGITRPWDTDKRREIPEHVVTAWTRGRS